VVDALARGVTETSVGVERIVSIPSDSIHASLSRRQDEGIRESCSDYSLVNLRVHDRTTIEIEGGFPPLSRNIAYSAIAIALSRSEATKATEYCRQVLAFEPNNSLINQLLDGLVHSETSSALDRQPILSTGLGNAVDDLPG
jgi:hypothetical protein